MTNEKRELIEILLDNVKPEDWPDNLPYAAQEESGNVYGYEQKPKIQYGVWNDENRTHSIIFESENGDTCRHQAKTIVTRDEFVKRWNERIYSETNATTPAPQQELHAEETKPIQQEVKATDTQIGGNHYTKLSINRRYDGNHDKREQSTNSAPNVLYEWSFSFVSKEIDSWYKQTIS